MALTSPYFTNRKRSSPTQASPTGKRKKKSPQSSKSSYFNRSPLSCFGSIARLGPLINTLTERENPETYCSRKEDCSCCKTVVNDVLSKFYVCDQFRCQWESQQVGTSEKHLTCWEKADVSLQKCARHLCPHRCYMRAFAPVREWIALREMVYDQAELPLDMLLGGWTCKLSAVESDSVFMERKEGPPQFAVLFLAPDGTKYSNKMEAAKAILGQAIQMKPSPGIVSSGKFTPPKSTLPVPDSSLSNTDLSNLKVVLTAQTPLGLLEELFCDDPWRLLMSTILLNRTSRVQVDTVYFQFLQRWPTALEVTRADPDEMCKVIRPLGMTNRRCAGIIRFSKEYIALLEAKTQAKSDHKKGSKQAGFELSEEDIQGLFHCGEYASAAYRIFVQRNFWTANHPDHALTWYVEYQRAKYCSTEQASYKEDV